MASFSKSNWLRMAFVNAPLIIVFGAAWISDHWPSLSIWAIVGACALIIGEGILLYFLAKPEIDCRQEPAQDVNNNQVAEEKTSDTFWPVAAVAPVEPPLPAFLLPKVRVRHSHLPRPRSSLIESWALNALSDNPELRLAFVKSCFSRDAFIEQMFDKTANRRSLSVPDELAKWQLVTHDRGSFNIVAGAFEIEHFHGQTNIRVLDPTRVTVEGEKRGMRSAGTPSEFVPPRYN